MVLNIELKSEKIAESEIEEQLIRNHYYLKHIADEINYFTFVEETGQLYALQGSNLVECDLEDLILSLRKFRIYEKGNIDYLFTAKEYLISPLIYPNFMEKVLEEKS